MSQPVPCYEPAGSTTTADVRDVEAGRSNPLTPTRRIPEATYSNWIESPCSSGQDTVRFALRRFDHRPFGLGPRRIHCYLCEFPVSRPSWCPVQTGYGPTGGGVEAPCVTWVLDERDVVGDNNLDLGVPRGRGKRGRVSVLRPSSPKAGGHDIGRS